MSKQMTADKALELVKSTAETKKRAAPIHVGSLAMSDEIRQGDVYFHCIGSVPKGTTKQKRKQLQLAPGTTQGSRHIITEATAGNCELYDLPNATPLDGPVLEVCKTPVEVSHPEHGHVVFTVPGVYRIYYQRQFAEELRRVMD